MNIGCVLPVTNFVRKYEQRCNRFFFIIVVYLGRQSNLARERISFGRFPRPYAYCDRLTTVSGRQTITRAGSETFYYFLRPSDAVHLIRRQIRVSLCGRPASAFTPNARCWSSFRAERRRRTPSRRKISRNTESRSMPSYIPICTCRTVCEQHTTFSSGFVTPYYERGVRRYRLVVDLSPRLACSV